MQRYTLMISVRDKARADIAVSADRIYYRFATADTVDEGDIPGPGEQLDLLVARLADAMRPLEGESPIADDDFSAKLFVDNKLQPNPNPYAGGRAPFGKSFARPRRRICFYPRFLLKIIIKRYLQQPCHEPNRDTVVFIL